MRKKFIILLLLGAKLAIAQEQGIQFVKGLNWQQVLAKAKAEHKYIFVDCYTTWCGPCKMMEQNTYPDIQVGDTFNRGFISVKLQMDKTAKDDEGTKVWYPVAEQFNTAYTIIAFPSFLFFDENGNAVHKAIGYQEPADFIKLAAAAQDPAQQFYTLSAAYRAGKLDYPGIAILADNAGALGDQALGDAATNDYVKHYLDQLTDTALASVEYRDFIGRHADKIGLSDKPFLQSLNKPGGAFRFACFVLANDIVYPALQAADRQKISPDWDGLEKSIATKFGEKYVSENDFLLDDKISWYKYKRDGDNYGHYLMLKTEKISKDSLKNQATVFNENAQEIFKYDHDPKDLQTALSWMQQVNKLQAKPDPAMLATQANLLYKLSRKQEALRLEKQVVELNTQDDLTEQYKEMRAGKATWPDQME